MMNKDTSPIVLKTNADYIRARKRRFDSAIEEYSHACGKISELKEQLYHAENETRITERIMNNCLDDMAFLEHFESSGTEFKIIDKLEDEGIEITKGWRLKNHIE